MGRCRWSGGAVPVGGWGGAGRFGVDRGWQDGTAMTDPAALPDFDLTPIRADPVAGAGSDPEVGSGVAAGFRSADAVPLRERVARTLAGSGYSATIDEDGDVAVTVQEQKLFIRCVDSVPALMRVFGQWLMDDLPEDELARLRAANAVTASVNLAKATVHGDRLVVAVDLLVGDDFHLASVLHASLDAVLDCVRSWHDTVLELVARG